MSTHVAAFGEKDNRWYKMKAIWDACEDALIEPPMEVRRYFGENSLNMQPDDKEPGPKIDIYSSGCVTPHSGFSENGYDIHIEIVPKEVKVIRVYNSW